MGRHWDLRFTRVPKIQRKCPLCDGHGVHEDDPEGYCDAPHKSGKRIVVSSRLTGREKLEVVIHEITHAAFWHLDEEYVLEFARDLSAVLHTRMGYRTSDEERL